MDNVKNLEELVSHAESLAIHARAARGAVAVQIRSEDPAFAALLDEVFPTSNDQGDWLFRAVFGRVERPIDLYIAGRSVELRRIVGRVVHGCCF